MLVSTNPQKVFWSGGFDSTFVVLYYLRQGMDVQPYYSNIHYNYQPAELATQEKIRQLILNHSDIKGKLLPGVVFEPEISLEKYPQEYQDAYWHIWKEPNHYQHIRLAHYVNIHDDIENIALGIMVGVRKWEKDHLPFLYDLWVNRGKLKIDDNGVGYYTKKDCDPITWLAFGKGIYPLVNITRKEMYQKYLDWNCLDILKEVRFCYGGIDGFLCGCCIPCQARIDDGILGFYDEDALRRVFVWRKLKAKKEKINGIPAEQMFRNYCTSKENLRLKGIPFALSQLFPISICNYFEKELKNIRIPKDVVKDRKHFLDLTKHC